MPCYDPRSGEYDAVLRRFACETLVAMRARGEKPPDYIRAWWEDHQQWDAQHGRPHVIGQHREKVG